MEVATANTNGKADPGEVLARVEQENVEFVRFWFTDILGQLKSFAVGKDELEDAFADGMGFDGSSITGFNRIEESDMIAMPDPSTFKLLPWRGPDHKVGRVFCDVLKPDGEPYEGDPRYVLKRALQRAKDMGFDHYYLGPELEFFLFKDDQGTEVLDKGGYFDLTTLDVASDFRRDVVFTLRDLGIPVEYTHHEVGPSQHEIDMRFADGLDMADRTMTYRIAVKEVAMAHGYYATFMPKPLFGENGSGMHTHQSLFKGDAERVLRRGRRVPPVGRGEVVHRRPAQARARAVGAVRAARQLVQAAGAGLRGAGLHRMVAAQPLRARAGADVPPRQGEGDADGAALPGSVVQPVPDVRRPAAGRARGDREGLRAARADGAEPLRPRRRRAGGARASSSFPRRSARRSRSSPTPS